MVLVVVAAPHLRMKPQRVREVGQCCLAVEDPDVALRDRAVDRLCLDPKTSGELGRCIQIFAILQLRRVRLAATVPDAPVRRAPTFPTAMVAKPHRAFVVHSYGEALLRALAA